MRLPEIAQRVYKSAQLFFHFDDVDLEGGTRSPLRVDVTSAPRNGGAPSLTSPRRGGPIHLRGRDRALEHQARELLRPVGADKLAREIRVEWNQRMRTCAGRADYREKLISLNPLLVDHAPRHIDNQPTANNLECNKHSSLTNAPGTRDSISKLECKMHSSVTGSAWSMLKKSEQRDSVISEMERTLRHELAHLLAQWRVGRRRIAPHGKEWRQACRDLGIADEARCHNLPFATKRFPPRYVYLCPNCKEKFPRVRRIRRAIACLACCRAHNRGEFDQRFRLRMIKSQQKETKETKMFSKTEPSFSLLASV
jgi:predicted SprT family Zn-dependent metalloprotease